MENREKYVEYVDACSTVRYEINSQLYDQGIGPIKKLSEEILGLPKPHYKLIHDMLYYKGGYPKDDSPSRLNDFLDRFIALYKYFEFLDHVDEIENYLNNAGITINLKNKIQDEHLDFPEDILQKWETAFPDEDINLFNTTKKFLDKLLDRSLALQVDICQLADSIKIDTAEKVEEECKIKKPYFLKAVSARAKQLAAIEEEKKKEIGNKVQEDADNHEDAVSIF
jgi:hypothetical protein